MTSSRDPVSQEDEIDLVELFYSLWFQKTLIALVTSVSLFASVVYALRAIPEYRSSAVFQIASKRSGPVISSELGGLASLAGLNIGGESPAQGIFDRVQGRAFILGVAEELSLDRDPYFNPYSGAGEVPSGLSALIPRFKSILAPASDSQAGADPKNLVEDAIVGKFGEVVTVTDTKNGSINIEVRHQDPDTAAALANTSMYRLLTALDTERKNDQSNQLAYLSEQLADALTAMNDTRERVQDFALNNSLVSTSAFATRSELMFRLRDELERSREMTAATSKVLSLAGQGAGPTRLDYAELRRDFPIVDDVDFRRLLGIPEALDQWAWPNRTRLLELQNILSDRAARARRELDKLQVEAEEYARASEELTALKRDASIAEATYKLLIEQTKTQAFAAGFNTDIAKIYQVAVAATRASAPKKSLIVALGAVLGLFAGGGIAIFRNARRGRLYSAGSVKQAAQARLFSSAPMRPLRVRKAEDLLEGAEALRPRGLVALAIELNEKSPRGILCASAGSRTHAAGPAMWIAAHLAKDHARVAMVDLSGELVPSTGEELGGEGHLWRVSRMRGSLDLLTLVAPLQADDLLRRNSFGGEVRDLMARYDRVIFSAAPDHAAMAHRALHLLSVYLVAICGGGLTRKPVLTELRDIGPIDACLSEP